MEGKQGAALQRKRIWVSPATHPPADPPTARVLGLVSASPGAMVRVQWDGEPGSPGFQHLGRVGSLHTEETT